MEHNDYLLSIGGKCECEDCTTEFAFIVMKKVKFDSSLDEPECVCLTRETANRKCQELQKEYDPEETTYRFTYYNVELFK